MSAVNIAGYQIVEIPGARGRTTYRISGIPASVPAQEPVPAQEDFIPLQQPEPGSVDFFPQIAPPAAPSAEPADDPWGSEFADMMMDTVISAPAPKGAYNEFYAAASQVAQPKSPNPDFLLIARKAAIALIACGAAIAVIPRIMNIIDGPGQKTVITESYDQFNARPVRPLTMGGYDSLWYSQDTSASWQAKNQAKYVADKAALEKAISACAVDRQNCNPRIKAFADMLEKVRTIPDRLEQVETINAWVNMIPYDYKEAALPIDNLHHHTLVETLSQNLATCDEAARLKLFALEKMGFDKEDIRWVALDWFKDGKRQEVGHAVTEVRIDGKIWVMNIESFRQTHNIGWNTAKQTLLEKSRLETDTALLNFSDQSFWVPDNQYLLPIYSFNANERGLYAFSVPIADFSNVPLAARKAVAETVQLPATPEVIDIVMPIMASAFAPLYTINGRPPSEAIQTEIARAKGQKGRSSSPPPASAAAPVAPRQPSATFVPAGPNYLQRWRDQQCAQGSKKYCPG